MVAVPQTAMMIPTTGGTATIGVTGAREKRKSNGRKKKKTPNKSKAEVTISFLPPTVHRPGNRLTLTVAVAPMAVAEVMVAPMAPTPSTTKSSA